MFNKHLFYYFYFLLQLICSGPQHVVQNNTVLLLTSSDHFTFMILPTLLPTAIPAAGRERAPDLLPTAALRALYEGQLCAEVPARTALSHTERESAESTTPQVNEPRRCGRAEQPRQSRRQREGEQGDEQEEKEG